MSNLLRRVRKLEARLTDTNGLVPHSAEWFSYWEKKLEDVDSDGMPVDITGLTLEVIDAFRERTDDANDGEATAPSTHSGL